MTQEFLACSILGVHRQSVMVTAGALQCAGMIR
jgi:hypothetical protein